MEKKPLHRITLNGTTQLVRAANLRELKEFALKSVGFTARAASVDDVEALLSSGGKVVEAQAESPEPAAGEPQPSIL